MFRKTGYSELESIGRINNLLAGYELNVEDMEIEFPGDFRILFGGIYFNGIVFTNGYWNLFCSGMDVLLYIDGLGCDKLNSLWDVLKSFTKEDIEYFKAKHQAEKFNF